MEQGEWFGKFEDRVARAMKTRHKREADVSAKRQLAKIAEAKSQLAKGAEAERTVEENEKREAGGGRGVRVAGKCCWSGERGR